LRGAAKGTKILGRFNGLRYNETTLFRLQPLCGGIGFPAFSQAAWRSGLFVKEDLAVVLEAGVSCRFARVCTETTIPYARRLEEETLPSVGRILAAVRRLLDLPGE